MENIYFYFFLIKNADNVVDSIHNISIHKKSLKMPTGVVRNRKSKKDIERTKEQTTIYKTLHRKTKIE